LLAVWISSAAADDCRPKLRTSVPVAVINAVPIVRLTIGNKEGVFVLDTGAEATILSTAGADRLELSRDSAYPRQLRGFNGSVVSGAAELRNVAAAGVILRNFRVSVGSIQLPMLDGVVPDGLLGADILSGFDLDLDVPHNRVRLFDRLTCPIAEPNWGRPFSLMEANRSLHNRLFFPVTLNGLMLAAIFDTGAQRSVVDTRVALAAGMDLGVLRRGPVKTVRGFAQAAGVQVSEYTFREFTIGTERVNDPTFLVSPLGLVDANLILGMDYMIKRRLWLSYGSHRIFLSRPF
jgi:predicted aspartyl protease